MKAIKRLLVVAILFQLTVVSTSLAESFGPQHDKVVSIFKSNDEPTAKDAVWTTINTFKVGVINDGSNRSGYAQYVCEVLNDEGFKGKGVWVQVIDIVKLNKSGKWVKLGETHCR